MGCDDARGLRIDDKGCIVVHLLIYAAYSVG